VWLLNSRNFLDISDEIRILLICKLFAFLGGEDFLLLSF